MTPDDDHELASAFAELRQRANHHFTARDTTDLQRAADARKARTRNFSIAAALLAATGLLTAGIVLQPPRDPQDWAPAQQSLPQQNVPQPARTSRPDLANLVRFLDDERTAALRESTITLPAWPGGGQHCPAGTHTFHDGKAAAGTDTYLLLPRASLGIYANLDGAPGDEQVVPIACGGTSQLLVLSPDDRHTTVLGYLPALPAFDRFYPYDQGLVVELLDNPSAPTAEQRRRYGWNGTRFVQTHGPRTLPADLTPDARRTDLRQSYLSVAQCGGGILSFLDGVSGTWPTDTAPAAHFELGQISTGLLHEPGSFAAEGDALITLTCQPDGRPAQTWIVKASAAKTIPVLKVGDDGVTAVNTHRITGGLAELDVQTPAGRQTWRYSSDGHTMTRTG